MLALAFVGCAGGIKVHEQDTAGDVVYLIEALSVTPDAEGRAEVSGRVTLLDDADGHGTYAAVKWSVSPEAPLSPVAEEDFVLGEGLREAGEWSYFEVASDDARVYPAEDGYVRLCAWVSADGALGDLWIEAGCYGFGWER